MCTRRTRAVDQPGPHQRSGQPDRLQYSRFSRRTGNHIANVLSMDASNVDVTARRPRTPIFLCRVIATAMSIWRKGVFVCVAGSEHIANMSSLDQSSVPCETRNSWRMQMTLHDGFTHFSFGVSAVRCQARGLRCFKSRRWYYLMAKMGGVRSEM